MVTVSNKAVGREIFGGQDLMHFQFMQICSFPCIFMAILFTPCFSDIYALNPSQLQREEFSYFFFMLQIYHLIYIIALASTEVLEHTGGWINGNLFITKRNGGYFSCWW